MRILVTGAAGFIGHQLCLRLITQGHSVLGLDNLNSYYDPKLKQDRLRQLENQPGFDFVRGDLADAPFMERLFASHALTHVVNLAAQAGVRYSLQNPGAYLQSNMVGFGNVLEGCRQHKIQHLVFASSSSVYGLNAARPYAERHSVDHPASLYAASKKANELMAHSYSHIYGLPCTGLRFFTVYGPWGRPDMAPHLFTAAILAGKPINIFNQGHMHRDFTYIDDIVEGVYRVLRLPPLPNPQWDSAHPDPASSSAPWRICNIGNSSTVELGHFIAILEKTLGREAVKNYMPMQAGDVQSTHADVSFLEKLTGFSPSTPLEQGIANFVAWYRAYYGV